MKKILAFSMFLSFGSVVGVASAQTQSQINATWKTCLEQRHLLTVATININEMAHAIGRADQLQAILHVENGADGSARRIKSV